MLETSAFSFSRPEKYRSNAAPFTSFGTKLSMSKSTTSSATVSVAAVAPSLISAAGRSRSIPRAESGPRISIRKVLPRISPPPLTR